MRVLLVTGRLAEPIVKKYASASQVKTDVIVLPFAVAALMTSRYIANQLRRRNVAGFDILMVPGLVKGDVSSISEEVGIPTFKGPRHAADLPSVFNLLDEIRLSTTIPACDLIREELNRRALKSLREAEENNQTLLRQPGNIKIGKLATGRNFPARILAEIVDAPKLTDKEIRGRTRYYADAGADIIDIGMIAGLSQPKEASRTVEIAKDSTDLPISIDTLDPDEIRSAVSAGIDLILSLDGGNIDKVSRFASNIPAVVIPTDFRLSLFPKEADAKIMLLEQNLARAAKAGFTTLIADPILDPLIHPGAIDSILAAEQFRRRHPYDAMMLGVGNVTELLDADTPGANAVLSGLAAELEASLLLTTEVSDKARGSVRELSRLADMMFIARHRNSAPKELGLDLLIMKEKQRKDEPFDRTLISGVPVVEAEETDSLRLDPKGCFKIHIDRNKGEIVLLHYTRPDLVRPDVIVRGKSASDVYKTVVRDGLLSVIEHAAYLGSELTKAEISLRLGRSYVQDSSIF
jgi:dihydropteroate synthase-like protein